MRALDVTGLSVHRGGKSIAQSCANTALNDYSLFALPLRARQQGH
jgi:hypothetical protein